MEQELGVLTSRTDSVAMNLVRSIIDCHRFCEVDHGTLRGAIGSYFNVLSALIQCLINIVGRGGGKTGGELPGQGQSCMKIELTGTTSYTFQPSSTCSVDNPPSMSVLNWCLLQELRARKFAAQKDTSKVYSPATALYFSAYSEERCSGWCA